MVDYAHAISVILQLHMPIIQMRNHFCRYTKTGRPSVEYLVLNAQIHD